MTLGELKKDIRDRLRQANIETPDLDARILLCEALKIDRTELILKQDDPIHAEDRERVIALAQRRASGEPVDHILGYREFYGRRFNVTADVLSPRPETELLVEKAIATLNDRPGHVLELGVGSGAIAITLALENPLLSITAVDVSEAALVIARENVKCHTVQDRINFLCGDWFAPVPHIEFDLIISNPPYIDAKAMKELSLEVQNFDPHLALYGGEDGLGPYHIIAEQSGAYLKTGGLLLLEIGYDQALSVSGLLGASEFTNIETYKDLSGHDRIISARGLKGVN